jgi:hypothetical protein
MIRELRPLVVVVLLAASVVKVGAIPIVIPTITHNKLDGLQGGTAGEYYHFTAADYAKIGNWDAAYNWGNHALANYLGLDTYPDADTDGTDDLLKDGSRPLTADWDVGAFDITNTGKIGVGIANPVYLIHVVSSPTEPAQLRLQRGANTSQATTAYIPAGTISSSNTQWNTGLLQSEDDWTVSTYTNPGGIVAFRIANTGNVEMAGAIQSGLAGTSGQLKLYSEQGGTDYTATLNPNSAMTSGANFYLPADEPAATYLLNMTSGGVLG